MYLKGGVLIVVAVLQILSHIDGTSACCKYCLGLEETFRKYTGSYIHIR